jgi:hypothetical protein
MPFSSSNQPFVLQKLIGGKDMKNYRNSDYAINKYSKSIVYRFSDRMVTVTLEDYLAENPNKTAKDFDELKTLSDEIYLEQARSENTQTKKSVSISELEETEQCATLPLEEEYAEIKEQYYTIEAVCRLFESGLLTETQKRRFILYFFKEMSFRQIAAQENVHFTSVEESIKRVTKKFKMFFQKN